MNRNPAPSRHFVAPRLTIFLSDKKFDGSHSFLRFKRVNLMSLYEHQDRCLSSPDELKAVIPQATPTPSFSLESPSVSPQEPGAGNHNGRPIELSLGTAVLLRYMGAPIEPPEDSFPLSDTVIGSIKSEKEDAEGLSRPATLSSRSREDVWRKDTRQSSKNLRVFSSASISSSKSVNRSAINANIDTNPSLAHEGVSPSEDNSLHPGASKAQSSMAHHTQSHGDRLPSFSQFETEISASHNNLRHTSSILPPTHCKVLAANNPSHLPPIASFSHKEPPSILEDSYSLPEQYTQKSLLPPNPVCKPRASYLNGNSLHFLQPVDGLQPNTPSLSSVHSGSDSYSGTDGYSPDNLPSPAENTRLSNRFAHETNFARIRTQSDNPSHTPYQSAGSYKCTAANCNARPFQTQYLLKCISLTLSREEC